MRGALLLAALALPAAAEIVPPPEFEALSRERTLTFEKDGRFYGAEQYGAGRQSLWQYADGTCIEGIWFPDGDDICFLYDGQAVPQCWLMERRGGDLYARFAGTAPGHESEIRLESTSEEPLACPGPDLGV